MKEDNTPAGIGSEVKKVPLSQASALPACSHACLHKAFEGVS